MIVMVFLCGLLAVLLAITGMSPKLQKYVIRWFRKSPQILLGIRVLPVVVAVLALIILVWFRDNLAFQIGVEVIFLLMLAGGAYVFDRFWIFRQPAANLRSYLVVAAHPGDIGYGCVATLARLRDAGHQIHAIILTNGRSDDDDVNDLPEKTRSWAELIGCATVVLGNIPVEQADHEVECINRLIREQMEKHQPDVLLTHSLHDADAEHLLAAQAVMQISTHRQAVYGFRSIATTVEFNPTRSIPVGDYVDLKNYILRDYHGQDVQNAQQEDFEMIRSGLNASL
ncbi:PIG-L deacetylase family protein [uncultured Corynebacterium sp.]|uniref:PIG-L deacetylase family protein n=1 Tax=uncultured Corynebacterium sp. TaxID=159447 RepID=UPI0025F16969|nr:PIG-L family deacetylase [uncultured Corynebacterium sp.]